MVEDFEWPEEREPDPNGWFIFAAVLMALVAGASFVGWLIGKVAGGG